MRPTGFTSFNMTPRLPREWNSMALRNIHSFGNVFDLEVTRSANNKLQITVKGTTKKQYVIKEGATQNIQL